MATSPGADLKKAQNESARSALASALALATVDEETDSWKRFASNLMNTISQRIAKGYVSSGRGIFVFVDKAQRYAGQLDSANTVFDLDKDPSVPLTGGIFLVGESANGGVWREVSSPSAALTVINDLGLGDRPTATYYAEEGVLRIYPLGLNDLDSQTMTTVQAPRPVFDLDTLLEELDEFHRRCLCTPQLTNPSFWDDKDKWVPSSQAEKNIQWPLRASFIAAFRPHILVEEEARNAVGIADFLFYEADGPRNAPPLAIVEAKVQKSQRASGAVPPSETAKEFVRGLIQTAAYRNEKRAGWSALVCFDHRQPGSGTDAAWEKARQRSKTVMDGLERASRGGPPHVFTWLVFANTEAAQFAQANGSLRSDDPYFPVTKRTA